MIVHRAQRVSPHEWHNVKCPCRTNHTGSSSWAPERPPRAARASSASRAGPSPRPYSPTPRVRSIREAARPTRDPRAALRREGRRTAAFHFTCERYGRTHRGCGGHGLPDHTSTASSPHKAALADGHTKPAKARVTEMSNLAAQYRQVLQEADADLVTVLLIGDALRPRTADMQVC
jgi:hypothetical protein